MLQSMSKNLYESIREDAVFVLMDLGDSIDHEEYPQSAEIVSNLAVPLKMIWLI